MTASKKLITYALLLFVGISVVYSIYKEIESSTAKNAKIVLDGKTSQANPNSCEDGQDCGQTLTDGIFAYYFHGYKRCQTCLAIESNIDSVIKERFEERIKDRTLEWKSINVQEQQNNHYINDFSIRYSTLIVGRVENGSIKEWKALDDVWKLVRDKEAFHSYVAKEVSSLFERMK